MASGGLYFYYLQQLIYFGFYGIDIPRLNTFLRPILTVASVRNTGEPGDINKPALHTHQPSITRNNPSRK